MSRECSREPTRRTFLQTVLCSASAALAGCSFDGGEGERGPTPRAESTPDPAETPSQDPGGPTPTESDPTATPEPVHPMAEEYDRAIDVVEEGSTRPARSRSAIGSPTWGRTRCCFCRRVGTSSTAAGTSRRSTGWR
ncbi:hypothetical protein ACFQL4_08350 [Halosimplex aquaticum]